MPGLQSLVTRRWQSGIDHLLDPSRSPLPTHTHFPLLACTSNAKTLIKTAPTAAACIWDTDQVVNPWLLNSSAVIGSPQELFFEHCAHFQAADCDLSSPNRFTLSHSRLYDLLFMSLILPVYVTINLKVRIFDGSCCVGRMCWLSGTPCRCLRLGARMLKRIACVSKLLPRCLRFCPTLQHNVHRRRLGRPTYCLAF